jgi:hypothetical protein
MATDTVSRATIMAARETCCDMSQQQDPNRTGTASVGASGDLEIRPTTRLEIGISLSQQLTHQGAGVPSAMLHCHRYNRRGIASVRRPV